MSSPLPTIILCSTYVLFVKKIGPQIMESRLPFDLRNTLVLYNGLQVLFSAWLFYEVIYFVTENSFYTSGRIFIYIIYNFPVRSWGLVPWLLIYLSAR